MLQHARLISEIASPKHSQSTLAKNMLKPPRRHARSAHMDNWVEHKSPGYERCCSQCFIGIDSSEMSYIVCDEVVDKVAKCMRGIRWKPALCDSQSDGVIEGLNRQLRDSTPISLVQACPPFGLWSYAIQHLCLLRNCSLDAADASPCETRHEERCQTLPIPFGFGTRDYLDRGTHQHRHQCRLKLSS